MTRVLVLLLSSLLLSLSAWATGTAALPMGDFDFGGSPIPLEVSKTSPEFTSISLTDPGVAMQQHVVDYETYESFGIPGEPYLMEEGNPAVPQVTRFYRIPNTGGVDLNITPGDFDLVEDINALPIKFEDDGFDQVRRSHVYNEDQWYPPVIAEMSDPMVMRDFRIVRVALYPVQVNPVTHQARLYHNISAEIVANGQPGSNEITHPRQISADWAPIYRHMIANLDDYALDDIRTTPGGLMIVTSSNSAMRPWADSLALWKTRKGFTVTVDARSNWTPASVRSAILTAYQTWDPPLEFVVLMGDPGWNYGIPVYSSAAPNGEFDHAYASLTAGDEIEDIGVGRLSGNSSSVMAVINAKIMMYEREPHIQTGGGAVDTTWYHKAFLYAGIARGCAGNQLLMRWAQDQFVRNTGVNRDTVITHPTDAVDNTTVVNQINGGVSFFLWRGTWVGGMPSDMANQTSPGNRLSITMTVTCNAGEYVSNGISGPAEGFLCYGTTAAPKGGVCGLGTSTIGTSNGANVILAGGFIYNIANAKVEHLGTAVAGAKAMLYVAYGPTFPDPDPYVNPGGPIALNFSRYFNLLGDPSLSVWTDVPKALTVTHPATATVGTHSMTLDVHDAANLPVPDALVVLWKGTESYVKGLTDVNGHIQLPLTIQSAGDLLVTVTKRGCKPYLATVTCSPAAQMVALSSYLIDDDNSGGTSGNSNGQLNPGEIIDLPLYLKNYGNSATATGVTAVLTSNDPRVAVVYSSSAFANIAPGDSAASATPFRVNVSQQVQNNEPVLLVLTVTASSIQTTSAVLITVHAGEPVYDSHSFTGTVNPGTTNNLRVTLVNQGSVTLTNATGQLVSLSPFVQIDDAVGSYGDIPAGQQASNANDLFTLTSNFLTFRGLQVPLRMIVTTSTGFEDTTQFTVSIGTATGADPTGPDAYGYYAYDNTDVNYEMHPTYSYVNISTNGGTNLNLNDVGDKISPTPIWSTARRLPFGFKFYGRVYDSLTVCSNGWCAFGDQSYLDMFRNYAIPSMGAPDAMIAPYWDDLKTNGSGQGVWVMNDVTNHRYIVQWKGGAGSGYATALDFEVMLYDTFYTPTMDGNGQVVVQYNTASMNIPNQFGDEPTGCSIGVQAPGNVIGLSYAYRDIYSPGAATVSSGRAIRFTTDGRMLFGDIQGTVLDAENNTPVPGVDVTIDGYSYHMLTDSAGHYLLSNVLIGTYTVRIHKRAYNDATVPNIVVELDSTETANFSMLHPELTLSRDSIFVSLPAQPTQTTFDIVNGGNGPLDYAINITYGGAESPDPWDMLDAVNLTQATGDYQMLGCEFVNDHWVVSGGSGQGGNNYLYDFDTHGNLVGSVLQPSNSAFGWFDLAYDGQYLYGSDSHVIVGVDEVGAPHDTVNSPLNPSRAIAYDPAAQHFWVADYTSAIYEISRAGTTIQQISNSTGLHITGMAWHALDADGFKLYLFCQNANGAGTETQLWRMHPVSHNLELVTTLAGNVGDRAGGLSITPGYNSTLLVLGGILQNSLGDRLGIYEISFNTTWITVTPPQQVVPGGSTQEVTVSFDPSFLRPDAYRVNLNIASNVLDSTYILPVVLTVTTAVPDANSPDLPHEYALDQNYPNPFNPYTTIRYDLKADGQTKLTVYNLVGQQIAVLFDGMQNAGTHELSFDASALPSGMYFYRLVSGDFVKSAKMILMK